MLNLGDKIKKLRELKNYTQQYLADELDLSISQYGKIERNQTEITINRLMKISQVLEIDLHALIAFNEAGIFNASDSKNGNSAKSEHLAIHSDSQNLLIQKYQEENRYLKELVKTLMEKNK